MRWILLALLFPMAAQGQTYGLDIGSAHIPPKAGQQNFNFGAYIKAETSLTVGAYRNTMGRFSAYAGWTLDRGPFSLTLGAVYGYQRRQTDCKPVSVKGDPNAQVCGTTDGSPGALAPFISPSVRLPETFGFTPRISFIPVYKGSSVIHLSIEKPF